MLGYTITIARRTRRQSPSLMRENSNYTYSTLSIIVQTSDHKHTNDNDY